MCRGFVLILVTFNNSTATRQISDCHHQPLLFVLIIFISIANMYTNPVTKKLIS